MPQGRRALPLLAVLVGLPHQWRRVAADDQAASIEEASSQFADLQQQLRSITQARDDVVAESQEASQRAEQARVRVSVEGAALKQRQAEAKAAGRAQLLERQLHAAQEERRLAEDVQAEAQLHTAALEERLQGEEQRLHDLAVQEVQKQQGLQEVQQQLAIKSAEVVRIEKLLSHSLSLSKQFEGMVANLEQQALDARTTATAALERARHQLVVAHRAAAQARQAVEAAHAAELQAQRERESAMSERQAAANERAEASVARGSYEESQAQADHAEESANALQQELNEQAETVRQELQKATTAKGEAQEAARREQIEHQAAVAELRKAWSRAEAAEEAANAQKLDAEASRKTASRTKQELDNTKLREDVVIVMCCAVFLLVAASAMARTDIAQSLGLKCSRPSCFSASWSMGDQ